MRLTKVANKCYAGIELHAQRIEMSKSRVTADLQMRQVNVRVTAEDSEFVQSVLRPQLGLPYNADVVREVISLLRTWFHLPAHVVDALKKDADAQKLHTLGYLHMLLHKRYESLVAGGSTTLRSTSTPNTR